MSQEKVGIQKPFLCFRLVEGAAKMPNLVSILFAPDFVKETTLSTLSLKSLLRRFLLAVTSKVCRRLWTWRRKRVREYEWTVEIVLRSNSSYRHLLFQQQSN